VRRMQEISCRSSKAKERRKHGHQKTSTQIQGDSSCCSTCRWWTVDGHMKPFYTHSADLLEKDKHFCDWLILGSESQPAQIDQTGHFFISHHHYCTQPTKPLIHPTTLFNMTRTESSSQYKKMALKDRHLTRHPGVHDKKAGRGVDEREAEAELPDHGIQLKASFPDEHAKASFIASASSPQK
jgi:hypothetical protein